MHQNLGRQRLSVENTFFSARSQKTKKDADNGCRKRPRFCRDFTMLVMRFIGHVTHKKKYQKHNMGAFLMRSCCVFNAFQWGGADQICMKNAASRIFNNGRQIHIHLNS